MGLRFYNTLTRQQEDFKPLASPKVTLYTCGPTVYNRVHIGNLRNAIFYDLLRRHLKARAFDVTQVMNITDVDDKIVKACEEKNISLEEITLPFTQAFKDDIKTIGIDPAEHYPKATDHIEDMLAMIAVLIERGYAYQSGSDVYFAIDKSENYGQLAQLDRQTLQKGASGRIDDDEYEDRDNPRDFALWKGVSADERVGWDSPFGRGRPGWHIECSAIAGRYLGERMDIHGGGVDLIFPHHVNEMAQCQGCHDQLMAHTWLHNAHLIVDGAKMSKSLGNAYTLQDVLDRGYDPLSLRYLLISTHYRKTLNFTFDSLDAAARSVRRLRDFDERLQTITAELKPRADLSVPSVQDHQERFLAALDDDLNISEALGVVFDGLNLANRMLDEESMSSDEAMAWHQFLNLVHEILVFRSDHQVPDQVMALGQERQHARENKDWSRADQLRVEIESLGWDVKDGPDGYKLVRKINS